MRKLFAALIALVLMTVSASAQVTVQNMHTFDRAGGGWYLVEGNHPILGGRAGIGFRPQRFVGVGPRFELKLTETLSIWTVPAAWGFEADTRNSLITLRYKP